MLSCDFLDKDNLAGGDFIVNHKSIGYINRLKDVSFVLFHREILRHAKKITNPKIAGVISTYEIFLEDLEKVTLVPNRRFTSNLNVKRKAAYQACRMAVRSLDSVSYSDDSLNRLSLAFSWSISKESIAKANCFMDRAEKIVHEIPRKDLEAYGIWVLVERFLKLNGISRQSQEAVAHNKKSRHKGEWYVYRDNCVLIYSCLLKLADNLAWDGDEDCGNFLAWVKSK